MTGTFRYENPDTIHFGLGCVGESLSAELDRFGAQRAFLVTTASAGKGAGRAVAEVLGKRLAGRYDRITQHSPVASVMEAATAARQARADVLVSAGGGTILAEGEPPLPGATAAESLRRMPKALLAAKADPRNAEARGEGQIAAWLSYLLPGPAARGLSHTLGKRIGSRHGIPHGVTSCLLLPRVVSFLGPRKPQALERLRAALGSDPAGAIADIVSRLGLPQHLSKWNLAEADLQEAVAPLARKPWSAGELLGIMR